MKRMRIRTKLAASFCLLVVALSGMLTVAMSLGFTRIYTARAERYIEDVSGRTVDNFEFLMEKIDRISQDILRTTEIQEQLKRVDSGQLSDYEMQKASQALRTQLGEAILFEDEILSAKVVSTGENQFLVSKQLGEHGVEPWTKEEILTANGSALWGTSADGSGRIVLSRAILDLRSMEPIGYMNVVCQQDCFETLLQEVSGVYSSLVFVVDGEWNQICTNEPKLREIRLSELKWRDSGIVSGIGDMEFYYSMGETMENGWQVITLVSTSVVEDELSAFRLVMVGMMIACMILGIGCICVITWQMIHPLDVLCENMEAIEGADFSKRIAITSQDEIGRLGLSYNKMAESIETLIEQVYQMELSQKQVEIELLKMQINPHFLYNTLDMINWMSRMGRTDAIVEVATALGQFLRANIKQGDMVPVQVELGSVHNYLAIQRYRFEDKMSVVYEIEEETDGYMIPNFSLQPLVENAIIHGLEPKIGFGTLTIVGRLERGSLYFAVADDGVGMEEGTIQEIYGACQEKEAREHIGIQNVYRRMKNYYGERMKFVIRSQKGKGTKIELWIPAGEAGGRNEC